MKPTPQTNLARATARAQRLESDTPGILARTAATALNQSFFAQRLAALRGVHRRQLLRLRVLQAQPSNLTF